MMLHEIATATASTLRRPGGGPPAPPTMSPRTTARDPHDRVLSLSVHHLAPNEQLALIEGYSWYFDRPFRGCDLLELSVRTPVAGAEDGLARVLGAARERGFTHVHFSVGGPCDADLPTYRPPPWEGLPSDVQRPDWE